MRISKVRIQNFRNFKNFEVSLSNKVVLLGENSAGKTNFIDALRLALDRTFRPQLGESDFHNDVSIPRFRGTVIQVDVFFEDFTAEEDFLAVLHGDCFCQDDPPIAQISFRFRPKTQFLDDLDSAVGPDYYESVWYAGGNVEKTKSAVKFREQVSLKVVKALRDIESDLNAWQRSPLRRLTRTMDLTSETEFQSVARDVKNATDRLRRIEPVRMLQERVQSRLVRMIEGAQAFDPKIGMLPTNPDELQKYLTFLVENELSLDRTSLGWANILYLALLMVEIELLRETRDNDNDYQFTILAIEEPEAHLHPHLQRLVFRDFLEQSTMPVILSTHSPNIASVAKPDWFVVLSRRDGETKGKSTSSLTSLSDDVKRDLERYLDVNRGEVVFARGVMLVEGDSELFLVPEFAEKMQDSQFIDNSLDGAGISIVSVSGTDFAPYVRFFGPEGLNLPLAIVTDGDRFAGLDREAKKLLKNNTLHDADRRQLQFILNEPDLERLRVFLEEQGIFHFEGLRRGLQIVQELAPHDHRIRALLPELERNYEEGNWDELREGLQHPNVGVFVNDWTLEDELLRANYLPELLDVYRELGASDVQVKNMRSELDQGLVIKVIERIKKSGKGRYAQRLADKVDANRIPDYIQKAIQHLVLRTPRISKPTTLKLSEFSDGEEE